MRYFQQIASYIYKYSCLQFDDAVLHWHAEEKVTLDRQQILLDCFVMGPMMRPDHREESRISILRKKMSSELNKDLEWEYAAAIQYVQHAMNKGNSKLVPSTQYLQWQTILNITGCLKQPR